MKRIIKVGIISLIALSSAALTGCDPKPVQTSSSPTSSVSSTTSTSSTLSSDSSIQASSSSEKQVIHVSSIAFATQSKKMLIGEAILLSVNVLPADADNKNVTYSIDNTDSFSITTAGLLTANKEGEVTVTATSVDGEKTATLSFTAVKPLEKIEGVSYFFEPKEGTKDLAQYPGAKNGDAVGYVNYNGYKQTIAVNATEEGKVSVYFNLANLDGTNPLNSLKVNGTETSDYAPLFDVSDSWDTFCRVHVANIDLVEGKNTIEIDVSKVVSKYDYMELVSPFVITETENDKGIEPITGTSFDFEPKAGTKDLGEVEGAKNGDAVCFVNYNGYSETFKITSTADGKSSLFVAASHCDGNNPVSSLTVNGTKVTVFASEFIQSDDWDKMDKIFVSNIDLIKGNNVIEMSIGTNVAKYDYMELVSESNLEKTIEEEPLTPIEGISYDFEPKAGTKDLGALEGAKNGDAVSYVNYNGYSETFNIAATDNSKASLFIAASHCDGNNPVTSLKVNDKEVTSFALEFTSSDDWDRMDKIFITNIDLVKGTNVIEMSIGKNVAKYDYMELVTTSTIDSVMTPVTGTSFDFEPKEGTKDLGTLDGAKNGDAVNYVNYNGYSEVFNITSDSAKKSVVICSCRPL